MRLIHVKLTLNIALFINKNIIFCTFQEILRVRVAKAFFLFLPRNSQTLLTYVYTVYVNRCLIVCQKKAEKKRPSKPHIQQDNNFFQKTANPMSSDML